MDALFHIILALAGGYMLAKGMNFRHNIGILLILSILSLFYTDMDHFIGAKIPIFHNIFMTILMPAIILVILYLVGMKRLREYLLILIVMLFGHLLYDMVHGIYGIPLFYPFSDQLYLMPANWETTLPWDQTAPLISRLGIASTIYFGGIFLIILLNSHLAPRLAPYLTSLAGILRKRRTRKTPSR